MYVCLMAVSSYAVYKSPSKVDCVSIPVLTSGCECPLEVGIKKILVFDVHKHKQFFLNCMLDFTSFVKN